MVPSLSVIKTSELGGGWAGSGAAASVIISIIRHHYQHTGSALFATLEIYPGYIGDRLAGKIMAAARISETYVLRTYPFREADLIVSFFTRDQGKLRGVARRARKPKSSFGSGLERLSLVNLSYSQKETRELVNLNSCDLVRSQFGLLADFEASVALDYIAEVSDHLLPPHEANEHFFRLLTATLEHMHTQAEGRIWRAVTYFSLWATRLSGFLPDLREQPKLSGDSREIAGQMLRSRIGELPERLWSKDTANDLRRFLIRQMEAHVERRFLTPPVIEAM